MKRTLSNPSNNNQPPKKRHKKNATPPIHNDSDKDKPPIIKSSTATSNTSTASNASSMTDDDNECCICFNKIELPITLECGHVFCFLCLKEIRMQSSSTFNFANFNCNINANDNDTDSDKNVEKFSCPYCRQEFDVKVIDKATMKKTEWMDNNEKKNNNKNDKNEKTEIIIWQYSGRKGGWWAYQKGHQKQLEKGFKKFMKELKLEQEKEEKTQKQMDNKTPSKYGFDNDDDDDDLGNEVGLLYHECMIEIGVRKYVVDFAQMIQFDYENPTRKRKITRKVETKQTLERSDSLKGCAGKFFDDNRNKKDENHDNKVDE